jgi:hypothetical protein
VTSKVRSIALAGRNLRPGWCLHKDPTDSDGIMPQKVFTECIKTRRLFNTAFGATKLEEREQKHIHECRVCQSVLNIFIKHADIQFEALKKQDSAA